MVRECRSIVLGRSLHKPSNMVQLMEQDLRTAARIRSR